MEILKENGRLELFEMKVEKRSKATSRRASDIEYFVSAVNGDQIKARRKLYTPAYIAFKLSHVKTDDLYPFFKNCLEYERSKKGQFSKAFFGALKTK